MWGLQKHRHKAFTGPLDLGAIFILRKGKGVGGIATYLLLPTGVDGFQNN